LYYNLEETFSDLRIPQGFTSKKALVLSWKSFYDFLKNYDKLFTEIKNRLNKEKGKGEEFFYPIVLTKIDKNRREVLDVLETILNDPDIDKIITDKKDKTKQSDTKLILKRDKTIIYDVAILTVLYTPEFVHIKNLLSDTKLLNLNDPSKTIYYSGILSGKGKKLKVLLACSNQMGMPVASTLTTKIIYQYYPKIIAMCGICAGIKGNIGDILAPDILWDYGSGKNYVDKISNEKDGNENVEKFAPYRYPEYVDNEITKKIVELSYERTYLDDIRNSYPEGKRWTDYPTNINVKIGPYASGAAVIANERILDHIKGQDGKLIGFDMEAYGVIYASNNCNLNPKPNCIVVKSVSDFGDSNKNNPEKDKHQDFAAYTSANYLAKLLINDIL
jgi:nucleoside phosphorylase